METLFSRLKAEQKEMLLKEYEKYPAVTEKGINDLKENHWVSDLRHGTVVMINNLDVKKAKLCAWDYFND